MSRRNHRPCLYRGGTTSPVFVPEGQSAIARRFNARCGGFLPQSPQGTDEPTGGRRIDLESAWGAITGFNDLGLPGNQPSLRDLRNPERYPALKRRAISGCPSGTCSSSRTARKSWLRDILDDSARIRRRKILSHGDLRFASADLLLSRRNNRPCLYRGGTTSPVFVPEGQSALARRFNAGYGGF